MKFVTNFVVPATWRFELLAIYLGATIKGLELEIDGETIGRRLGASAIVSIDAAREDLVQKMDKRFERSIPVDVQRKRADITTPPAKIPKAA